MDYKKSDKKYTIIKVWDEDNFEMSDANIKVRFLKFEEEIHIGDKIEFRQAWIITTYKFTSSETLWKIMHNRWHIENNVFHQLKTEWYLDHCFLHSLSGVETVLMFILIAFNLMQLYFFRCIRGFMVVYVQMYALFSRNPTQFSHIKITTYNEKVAKLYQYLSY